jgi:hypothetical protein
MGNFREQPTRFGIDAGGAAGPAMGGSLRTAVEERPRGAMLARTPGAFHGRAPAKRGRVNGRS